MTGRITVELVLGVPDRQELVAVELEAGATVTDVVAASDIQRHFPELSVADLAIGVWGREVPRNHVVREGDRVELYRPLAIDPREARRKLALAGGSMRAPPGDGALKDPD